jgi:hypothetical protein
MHQQSPARPMTIWPASQHFEEKEKGSIEIGKLADFARLDQNPLTVPQDLLVDIKVAETIKDGVSIYTLQSVPRAFSLAFRAPGLCFYAYLCSPKTLRSVADGDSPYTCR